MLGGGGTQFNPLIEEGVGNLTLNCRRGYQFNTQLIQDQDDSTPPDSNFSIRFVSHIMSSLHE